MHTQRIMFGWRIYLYLFILKSFLDKTTFLNSYFLKNTEISFSDLFFLIFLYVSENKSKLNYKSTKIPLPVKVCEQFPSVSSLLVIGEDEGGRSNFSSINNKNKTKTIEMSSLRQTPLTCSGHTRPVVFLAFSSINEEGHYFSISACKGRFLYLIIIVNI